MVRPSFAPRSRSRPGELRAQVRENRQHAAVIVLAVRELELAEDFAGVLLRRALGGREEVRDAEARAALRHRAEALALPRPELSKPGSATGRNPEPCDRRGTERGAATC